MYVVSGWCLSNVKASLQEVKPDLTNTTCRISIQQSASVVFAAFWLVLPFKEKKLILYGYVLFLKIRQISASMVFLYNILTRG